MKRFSFPLRPLAVIRAHLELRAREVFAAAMHAYAKAEERLAATRARVAALEAQLFAGRRDRFLAAEAAQLFRVYRAEAQAEIDAERQVVEARALVDQRRGEYLEANRRLKIVQRLEEKARTRHRAETLRAEQAEHDEFAGFRSAQRAALS